MKELNYKVVGNYPYREHLGPVTLAKFCSLDLAELFVRAMLPRYPANVYRSFEIQSYWGNQWRCKEEFKADGS